MKLRKGYEITTRHGDTVIVYGAMSKGTLAWAKRHGYGIKRIKVLA